MFSSSVDRSTRTLMPDSLSLFLMGKMRDSRAPEALARDVLITPNFCS